MEKIGTFTSQWPQTFLEPGALVMGSRARLSSKKGNMLYYGDLKFIEASRISSYEIEDLTLKL